MRRLLPLAVLLATPALATGDDLRSVAGMQGHSRVLLVFSPSLKDQRLDAQRAVMARMALDAAERDVVFVQVSEGQVLGANDRDEKLRRKFETPAPRYRTLLIGKDGKVAVDSAGPLDQVALGRAIDSLPSRQDEVRRARAGAGMSGS